MSNVENSGALSKTAGVSLNRAAMIGKAAGNAARELLLPYSEGTNKVLLTVQLGTIVARESKRAAEQYLDERIAGLHNDDHSIAPGLTAIVKPDEKEHLQRLLFPFLPDDVYFGSITEVEGAEGENQLFAIRLPRGGYKLMPESILITDVVEQAGEDSVKSTEASSASGHAFIHDVVTIIGDSGEYWQNPSLNPDGTNKE